MPFTPVFFYIYIFNKKYVIYLLTEHLDSLEPCINADAFSVFSFAQNKAVILYSHRQLIYDV